VHQLGVEPQERLEQTFAVVRVCGDCKNGSREQDDGLFDARHDVALATVFELDQPGGLVEMVMQDPALQKV
jgi:hypothetical protein